MREKPDGTVEPFTSEATRPLVKIPATASSRSIKSLTLPGLLELADVMAPTQLVLCEKDRIFPTPRGNRHFVDNLPPSSRIVRLPGLGHVPMLEAPGQITELIVDFVDENTGPLRAKPAS